LQNGISNPQLHAAVKEKQRFYRQKMIAGVNLDKIYNGFE
jgi:hypothetical protein